MTGPACPLCDVALDGRVRAGDPFQCPGCQRWIVADVRGLRPLCPIELYAIGVSYRWVL